MNRPTLISFVRSNVISLLGLWQCICQMWYVCRVVHIACLQFHISY